MSRHLCLIFALSLAASPLTAANYFDSARVQTLLNTQTLLFNDRFSEVDSIYRELIAAHPDDPSAYLFRAGALFAEMSDREDNLKETLFKDLIDSVKTISERVLDSCGDATAAWMYLWRGHARAYRSLYESKFGSSLSALKLGMSSIDEYEKGRRKDSTLVDLYMGIGSYHYWKSAKAGMLRWLGLFKDEKDKGIAELRRAAEGSLLHRELARSALIWIWIDRHEYDSAIILAEEFVRNYPRGRAFLWPIAQACYRRGDYGAAAEVFAELRARLDPDPGNYFNLIECDWHLAQCCTWMEEVTALATIAARFRTYENKIPKETRKRQSAKINYLQRVVK